MQAGGQGQNVLTPDGKIWAIPSEDQSWGLQLPLPFQGEGVLGAGSSGDGEASSRFSIWLQGAGTEAKGGPSVTPSPASSLEQEQAELRQGMGGQLSSPGRLRLRWE